MPRNLRVLLIDDQPSSSLYTDWLDVIRVPEYGQDEDSSEETVSIQSWAQHLWCWASDNFPRDEPDLVVIDAGFHTDRGAPVFAANAPDSRGLLHGVIYLSRLAGRDHVHPFGFHAYSQAMDYFVQDPWALTLFGFLCAFEERNYPEENRTIGPEGTLLGLRGQISFRMENTSQKSPKFAWKPALQMYRSQLAAAFASGRYSLSELDKKEALASVVRIQEPAKDSPVNNVLSGSLRWRRYGGNLDDVNVASLFADFQDASTRLWSDDKLGEIEKWFENLKTHDSIIPLVLEWLQHASEGKEPPVISRSLELGEHKYLRPLCYGMLGISTWLQERASGRKTSATALIDLCGANRNQIYRFSSTWLDRSWAQTINALNDGFDAQMWPFPGESYVEEILRRWASIKRLPFPFNAGHLVP